MKKTVHIVLIKRYVPGNNKFKIRNKQSAMLKKKMNAYNRPEKLDKQSYYPFFRTIESEQDTLVKINSKDVLMFGSNSYLGLTNHPKIKEESKKAIDKYGSGSSGSMFLNGLLDIHLELEEKIAKFLNKDKALIFSAGYQVNLGVISSIPGRHDFIILDENNHASIFDGARLSFANIKKYRHSNMDSLENILKSLPLKSIKLIITDGVFSMGGDIAEVPQIVGLAKKYHANVMLDDAHGVGVLEKHGKGTSEYFGMTKEIDLIMGSFSKSLASVGGFIASDSDTINYLKHFSRALMFSASLAPSSVASVIAALDIIEKEPERIEKLWKNTNHAKRRLIDAGLNTGNSKTPIIPIFIEDEVKTLNLTKALMEKQIFVNAVLSPGVPVGNELIRISIMATHSTNQIDEAIDQIIKGSKQLGII